VVLTEDKSRIGSRIGMGFAFLALGTLVGGPGAGAILGSNLDWTSTWVFGGVMMIGAGVVMAGLRSWKFGAKLTTKA
jgi:hypothetical protein